MKASEKTIRFLSVFLTACAVSVGSVFTFSTGFSIQIRAGIVIPACIVSALLASLLCLLRQIRPFLLGLAPLCCLGAWLIRKALWRSLVPVICAVGELYIRSFSGLRGASLDLAPEPGADGTLFLALTGSLLAFLCVLSLTRLRRLLPFLPLSLLLLISCLVSTLSIPSPWPLLLLFLALLVLLLTQGQRRRQSPTEYLSLLCWMLPSALLLLAAVWFIRPAEYRQTGPAAVLHGRLSDLARRSPFLSMFQPPSDEQPAREVLTVSEQIDLNALGPREELHRDIFRIRSARERTLYLKEAAYGYYENNSWQLMPDHTYRDHPVPPADWHAAMVTCSHGYSNSDLKPDPEDVLLIEPIIEMTYLLIPNRAYRIPEEARIDRDRFVEAPDQMTEYEISLFPYESGVNLYPASLIPLLESYKQVPDSTRAALRDILSELRGQAGDPEAPDYTGRCIRLIETYVRGSAAYSPDTGVMPAGDDFVRWFLEDCGTGYCIHFASAAAILLRCFGIPARYISGFSVTVPAGSPMEVSGSLEHAWVEYFDGTGWQIMDPTPFGVPSDPDQFPVPEDPEDVTEEPDAEDVPYEPHDPDESVPASPAETGSPESFSYRKIPLLLRLIPLFLLLCLPGRLALLLYRQYLDSGGRREQLLHYYRCLERLSRMAYRKPDDAMRELAEKARFSPHLPSPKELGRMRSAVMAQRQRLRDDPSRIRRFFFRVILGI